MRTPLRSALAAAALVVGAHLSGCSLLLDAEALGGGDAGLLAEDSGRPLPIRPEDGRAPTTENDAGDSGGPSGECSGTAGPLTTQAPGFCIDTTEVTNADYARFLAAVPAARPELTAGRPCGFKTTYQPANWPKPSGNAAVPVTEVDWCDAYAFCAWAGKRLCGRVGGGASSIDAIGDSSSQWFSACSQDGASSFPYGATYDFSKCHGSDVFRAGAAVVASATGCEGGYPGIFDMSGNVAEWEDACDPGSGDACAVRGGSYVMRSLGEVAAATQACDAKLTLARGTRAPDVGFRCCGP